MRLLRRYSVARVCVRVLNAALVRKPEDVLEESEIPESAGPGQKRGSPTPVGELRTTDAERAGADELSFEAAASSVSSSVLRRSDNIRLEGGFMPQLKTHFPLNHLFQT